MYCFLLVIALVAIVLFQQINRPKEVYFPVDRLKHILKPVRTWDVSGVSQLIENAKEFSEFLRHMKKLFTKDKDMQVHIRHAQKTTEALLRGLNEAKRVLLLKDGKTAIVGYTDASRVLYKEFKDAADIVVWNCSPDDVDKIEALL
jgi:hypothetical protein